MKKSISKLNEVWRRNKLLESYDNLEKIHFTKTNIFKSTELMFLVIFLHTIKNGIPPNVNMPMFALKHTTLQIQNFESVCQIYEKMPDFWAKNVFRLFLGDP